MVNTENITLNNSSSVIYMPAYIANRLYVKAVQLIDTTAYIDGDATLIDPKNPASGWKSCIDDLDNRSEILAEVQKTYGDDCSSISVVRLNTRISREDILKLYEEIYGVKAG